MNRQQHDVTEAELALLQSLWDAGPATIRQLVARVYKQGGRRFTRPSRNCSIAWNQKDSSYRDRTGPVHVFRPAVLRVS